MNFWRRFFSRPRNWIGLSLAIAFMAVALAGPVISPQDVDNPGAFKVVGRFTDATPHPPGHNAAAILGTLPGQFDVFHALVWGCRDAVRFGLLAAVGAFVIGVLFGAISGYAGGVTNTVMMRFADSFLTFPPLAGAVFLQLLVSSTIVAMGGQYFFNPQMNRAVIYSSSPLPPVAALITKIDPLLISLVLFCWMPHARLVNSIVVPLKQAEFVLAARATGGAPSWLIRRHILPNSIAPAIVLAARDVGSAVILQATMAVIGLGSTSPWGTLLALGRNWITAGVLTYWWVYIPVTVLMVLFGITWNLLGDGLGEALWVTS
jgi:peptide/nickel transport system permease protein